MEKEFCLNSARVAFVTEYYDIREKRFKDCNDAYPCVTMAFKHDGKLAVCSDTHTGPVHDKVGFFYCMEESSFKELESITSLLRLNGDYSKRVFMYPDYDGSKKPQPTLMSSTTNGILLRFVEKEIQYWLSEISRIFPNSDPFRMAESIHFYADAEEKNIKDN